MTCLCFEDTVATLTFKEMKLALHFCVSVMSSNSVTDVSLQHQRIQVEEKHSFLLFFCIPSLVLLCIFVSNLVMK